MEVSMNMKERVNSFSWNMLQVPGHVSQMKVGELGRCV